MDIIYSLNTALFYLLYWTILILSSESAKVDPILVDIKNQQRLQLSFDSVKQRETLKRDRAFFVTEPSDTRVNQGSTITLPCVLNETALSDYVGFPIDVTRFELAWIKNGEPVLIDNSEQKLPHSDSRYKVIGDRSRGEFHIRITDVDMKEDSGIWRCKFNNGLISSVQATLNVIQHVGPDLKIKSPSQKPQQRSTVSNKPTITTTPKPLRKRPQFVPAPLPLAGEPMETGIKPYHACLDDKFLVTIDFTLRPEDLPEGKDKSIWLMVPKSAYASPNYTSDQLLGLSKGEFLKSLNQIFHIKPSTEASSSRRRIKRVKRTLFSRSKDPKCKLEYTYNPNSGDNSVSFYIPYNDCGTSLSDYFGNQRISNLTNSVVIILNKNKDGSGDMEFKHHVIENNGSLSPLGNKWTHFSYFAYDPPQRILGTFVFSCFIPTPMNDMKIKMGNHKGVRQQSDSEYKHLEISKEPVPQKRQLPSDCPTELKDMDFKMEFDCQNDGFDIKFKFPHPYTGEIKVMGDNSDFQEKCNYKLTRQLNYKVVIPYDRCSTHSSVQYEPYINGILMAESDLHAANPNTFGPLAVNQNLRNRPLFTKFSDYNTTLYFEQHCSRSFNIRKINCQRWDPLYTIPENF